LRTSEPDSLAKNLFEDFDQPFKEPVDRHSAKKPLNSESVQSCVEGLEQSLAGMSLDERVAIEKQHTSHFDDKTDIENKKDCASMDSIPRVPTNLPPDSVLTPASRYSQSASNMFDGSSDYLGESELRTSVETPYTNVPHTDKPFFIHGNFPSKLDIDVFRATEGVDFNVAEYPLVNQWRQDVCRYSAEERCSWPSPCSPKYRSRLSKKSAYESQLS